MWDKEVLEQGHNRYRESGKFIRPKSLAQLQRVLCLAPKLPPLINKLHHDHFGPLIPVCVQLKQSNPATHAQPRVHRACKFIRFRSHRFRYAPARPPIQDTFSISRLFHFAIPYPIFQLRDVRIDRHSEASLNG